MITQSLLKELLHYDPNTGVFTWNVSPSPGVRPGAVAGNVNHNGHRIIQVRGRRYPAQHLAFLYMTGSLPSMRIDHRNYALDDNRWSNLREATDSQINHRKSARNPIARGVQDRGSGRFEAGIVVNGVSLHLGRFDSADEAANAAAQASIEHFGEFATALTGGGSRLSKTSGDRRGEVNARVSEIGVFQS